MNDPQPWSSALSESAASPGMDFSGSSNVPSELIRFSRLALIGEMVACFAHEVSNPLMLVQGHLQLIEEQTPDDDPNLDNVRVAVEAAERLGSMAARMLDFRKEPSYEGPFDVSDAIADAHRFVRPYLNMRAVSFEFESGANIERISADRNFLIQVLINLFQNAADAMVGCPERELRVSVTSDRDRLQINVEDTGEGISTADLGRVFEPFFTTKGVLGTGLGLYIAKRIVMDELKGAITAQNGSHSTTFAITLPLEPAAVG